MEITAFRREFKFTIIVSLLLYLYENRPTSKFFCKLNDSVQVEGLDYALRFVEQMMMEAAKLDAAALATDDDERRAEIIKMSCRKSPFSVIQWRQIIVAHEDLVKLEKRFRIEGKPAEEYIQRIQHAAKFLLEYFPERHYEVGALCFFFQKFSCKGFSHYSEEPSTLKLTVKLRPQIRKAQF